MDDRFKSVELKVLDGFWRLEEKCMNEGYFLHNVHSQFSRYERDIYPNVLELMEQNGLIEVVRPIRAKCPKLLLKQKGAEKMVNIFHK